MKSLLLATAFTLLYTGLVTRIFRRTIIRERAGILVAVFAGTVPLFTAVSMLTPPDLGFLPAWLVEHDAAAELTFGLILYFAAFFGGVLQLYNLSDRGLSLRMLIDIAHAPGGYLTVDGIMNGYSDGRGIHWMYQKRIEDLLSRGLVTRQQEFLALTARGLAVARFFAQIRHALKLD